MANSLRRLALLVLGEGQFVNPSRVDVDGFGNVYVADFGTNHIDKFTPDGKFITSFGSLGKGDGQLYFPTDVFVDHVVGHVWVVDRRRIAYKSLLQMANS